MYFEENLIYHLYNQGNNKQPIFFSRENYLFFLRKVRTYLLPYCDILCYCLMPNHFHFLIYVNAVELEVEAHLRGDLESPRELNRKTRTFNQSIAILLRSYTRAIHKERGSSGALFREGTKAKNGIIEGFITVDGKQKDCFFGGTMNYEATCFQYIHENPEKAGLVKKATDWEFSSAKDYAGIRNGTLCNQQLAKTLGLF